MRSRLLVLILVGVTPFLWASCATLPKTPPNAAKKNEALKAKTADEAVPKPAVNNEKIEETKALTIQMRESEKIETPETTHPKENLFSLHFREITLDSIISLLADRGKNFRYVIHPDVGERKVLGLALENITWRDALQIIAKLHNLDVSEEHGLIIVNTSKNAAEFQTDQANRADKAQKLMEAERKKQLEEAKTKDQAEGERKTYRTFKLKYAEPTEVVAYLNAVINGLTESGAPAPAPSVPESQPSGGFRVLFGVFTKASLVTAYGSPTQLEDVAKRLSEIDVPQRQIYIEARIVEVYRNYSHELGIEWGGSSAGGQPALSSSTAIVSGSAGAGGTLSNAAVSLPANAISGSNAAGVNLSLSDVAGTTKLNIRLSALETEGKSKTISNPKITTINGVKAEIKSGREIPYQQSAGGSSGATTIAFKNAVISLSVTPFVTPDDKISLKITVKKDVSKIPILGWFFKGKSKVDNEKELLIFITPRIVKGNFS
ncbi:MAG: hypothetical protein HY280_06305 [Nitrospinae bacterium]|nr:hypothetical protein [Nitrospinota bacterium]